MGIFSNKIPREDLKPGDHIYSWRVAHVYAHHGIYVGDGKVIHFTRPRTKAEILVVDIKCYSSPPGLQCPTCISSIELSRDLSTFSGVISSCLECFLDGGDLYRYGYDVNRAAFVVKTIGGTCTLAPSDPPEDVLHRAKSLLRHQFAFGNYKLFQRNCETFALYCKTSLMTSKKTGQANSVSAASGAAAVAFLAGFQLGGYVIYSCGRLDSDIGNKKNKYVEKIHVEKLVAKSMLQTKVMMWRRRRMSVGTHF